jgi:hypothetical protein
MWRVDTPTDQGDIKTVLPQAQPISEFYGNEGVTPLSVLNDNNASLFLGFSSADNLATGFEIRNDSTPLAHKGTMQPLIKRNEASPFNAMFTIYCPHKDIAPLGHIGLIEAFTIEFDNDSIEDPFSPEAQTALTNLASRMQDYSGAGGVEWTGNFGSYFLDQSTSIFALGGFMTYQFSGSPLQAAVIPAV